MNLQELIPIKKIAEQIPPARSGRKCHFSTVLRWIINGIHNRTTGQTIKLAATRVGNRWPVSPAALEQFCPAINPVPQASDSPGSIRTPAQRRKASARAERELQKIGI